MSTELARALYLLKIEPRDCRESTSFGPAGLSRGRRPVPVKAAQKADNVATSGGLKGTSGAGALPRAWPDEAPGGWATASRMREERGPDDF